MFYDKHGAAILQDRSEFTKVNITPAKLFMTRITMQLYKSTQVSTDNE